MLCFMSSRTSRRQSGQAPAKPIHRAKHGGTLGGVDLKQELYSAFLCAVTAEGTAAAPKPASTVAYHGLLSVLHPWSKALEDLSLDAVSKKVA